MPSADKLDAEKRLMAKEKKALYSKKIRAIRRINYLMKHGPCKTCGSWKRLEFHHRDPKDKLRGIDWDYSKERREKELAKCDILCHDCHLALKNAIMIHGTHSCYRFSGCRCKLCKRTHSLANKNWYKNQKEQKDKLKCQAPTN